MIFDKLDFTCIYSFTLDAIVRLQYDDEKVDAYRKAMFASRKYGKLRPYVEASDYENILKEFDKDAIKEIVKSHYEEAGSIAKQCV